VGGALTALDGALTTTKATADKNTSDITNIQNNLNSGTVGLVQQNATTSNITVASDKGGDLVNFTGTDGERKLTGIANGEVSATSTDAVTGKQLNTVVDSVTGLTGRMVTAEDNIDKLKTEVGSGAVGLVQQNAITNNITVAADKAGTLVDFAGTDGERKLTGIANGEVSATSTDAVTGKQLNATNAAVDKNTGDISKLNTTVSGIDGNVKKNTGDITDINTKLSGLEGGSVGLVQQNAGTGDITVAAATGGSVVNFAGTAGGRVLTGVANGVNDSDAVTIAQLRATGLIDYTGKEIGAVTYDDLTLGSVSLGDTTGLGTFLNNVRAGDISAGSKQAVNGGQLFAMQQKYDKQFSDMDDRVKDIESGGGVGPVLPPGTGGGVGEGSGGPGSIVVGDGADASGKNSTAIGSGAKASGENSVALGNSAVADRDNEVSVGAPGQERFLGNVRDGERDTDAVNVRQLNNAIGGLQNQVDTNRRDAMGGTAAAMAVAGLPQSSMPGRTFMAVAGSTYGGEQGTALGVSYMSKDGRWMVKSAVNTSSRGEVGAVVGRLLLVSQTRNVSSTHVRPARLLVLLSQLLPWGRMGQTCGT
jgi:autotransporter adhesin